VVDGPLRPLNAARSRGAQPVRAGAPGLLGIASFGWSTLATIVEISPEERDEAIAQLAARLLAECGAPDADAAQAAAEAEIAYAMELAEPALGTLVAIHRSVENGEITERFRTLLPGTDDKHGRVFDFIEEPDDIVEENIDLLGLMKEAPAR